MSSFPGHYLYEVLINGGKLPSFDFKDIRGLGAIISSFKAEPSDQIMIASTPSNIDWSKLWTVQKVDMPRRLSVVKDVLEEVRGRGERICDSYWRGGKFFYLVEKAPTQDTSLDTDTQWFVMPKDLKETSRGKTIGLQENQCGWSCYEDD